MKSEGDKCKSENCNGTYEFQEVENCSCHLNAPCGACTGNPLICNECLEEEVE